MEKRPVLLMCAFVVEICKMVVHVFCSTSIWLAIEANMGWTYYVVMVSDVMRKASDINRTVPFCN